MQMKYYTVDHEWVEVKGEVAFVGISVHAAEELGDVTFVELPHAGDFYNAGDTLGVVESVKAASDVYAPISGKVIAINSALENKPETVNESAEDKAWFCQIQPENMEEIEDLMNEKAYAEYLKK